MNHKTARAPDQLEVDEEARLSPTISTDLRNKFGRFDERGETTSGACKSQIEANNGCCGPGVIGVAELWFEYKENTRRWCRLLPRMWLNVFPCRPLTH